MDEQRESTRLRVNYSGRVQGVGFRATTRAIAGRFAVTGYVKNLPDGSVEVLAEGAPEEVDRFLSAVESEFRGHITERTDQEAAGGERLARFEIRY